MMRTLIMVHAAAAMHLATPQRRHVLKGCGLAIAGTALNPYRANADDDAVAAAPVEAAAAPVEAAPTPVVAAKKPSAIDDCRDRSKRYAEFSKTLNKNERGLDAKDKARLNAAYAEMVSFEKELASMAPTKQTAEGAQELKKVLRELYDAAKKDDRKLAAEKVGRVSEGFEFLADALQAAKNGGVFLDEQPIGKLRSDWQPGPGYEQVKSRTYSPSKASVEPTNEYTQRN